jgi:BirA family biotin operon repressor/biotin-[acetyl-CoA-carboxylase] ligase
VDHAAPPSSLTARLRAETFVRHLEWHAELPSTNDRALSLARETALPTPALIFAERQTAGRGRGANTWRSSAGSLTFSLLIAPPAALPRVRMPILSLAAGLATREAVASVAKAQSVKVKWPNDVYLNGRKLAGILTEVPPSVTDRVVIGIGINVNNSLDEAPHEIRQRAVTLREVLNQPVDVEDLLIALLIHLEAELHAFTLAGGLPPARWLPHCLLTGRNICLRTSASEIAGHCIGIADDGALLLDDSGMIHTVYAGEVIAF